MEKRGIPAVAVVTEVFVSLAKSAAAAKGYPDLPMVIVPHPFETLSEDQVVEIAREKFDEIVSKITKPIPQPIAP